MRKKQPNCGIRSRTHEEAIVTFLRGKHGWRTTLLRKQVDEALLQSDESPLEQPLGFIPDAFKVDAAKKTVHLLEVETSHPIKPDKLQRILSLWCDLDCRSWSLTLTISSTLTASTKKITDYDLQRLYYRNFWGQRNANATATCRLT